MGKIGKAALICIAVAAAAMIAAPAAAFAFGGAFGHHGQAGASVVATDSADAEDALPACGAYADANGDGVCDNCLGMHGGSGTAAGCVFADGDGDGVCDSCGEGSAGAHRGYAEERHGHGLVYGQHHAR